MKLGTSGPKDMWRCANMRVEAQARETLAITPTLTLKFQWYEYQ